MFIHMSFCLNVRKGTLKREEENVIGSCVQNWTI